MKNDTDDSHDEEWLGDHNWTVKHVVEYSVARTWSRLNNLAWTYFDIAQDMFSDFLILERSPIKYPGPDNDPVEHYEYKNKILKVTISTIVFSAMTCEAAIYDLAAIHLSDEYATKVLDKLDVVAKWLVVPRLICGKSLDDRGPAINGLRSLIRTRNALVHHKSQPGTGGFTDLSSMQKALRDADDDMVSILKHAHSSFQTMILLSLELNRVLGTVAGSLPFFEKRPHSNFEEGMSKEIAAIVQRCREIDAKASFSKPKDNSGPRKNS